MFSRTKSATVCIKLRKLDKLFCQKGLFQSWILIMILIHKNTGKANSIRGIAKKNSIDGLLGLKEVLQEYHQLFRTTWFLSILKLDADSLFHCGCICLFVWPSSSENVGLKFVKFLLLFIYRCHRELAPAPDPLGPRWWGGQLYILEMNESIYIQKEVGRSWDVVLKTPADTKDKEWKFWV
jgi:hypothetical protein